MDILDHIWVDFCHARLGDEYLVLYSGRQKEIRRWFKIVTILLSAEGIFSAFKDAKIPTVISFIVIGIIQLLSTIENQLIRSEKEVDEIGKLRVFYYERSNKLEKLFLEFRDDKITDDDARSQLFALRGAAVEIEELDTKLNIKKHKKLFLKADTLAKKQLNQYYNE
jgi:hypothetical protein